MSGFEYEIPCPNCGQDADCYSETKPFDYNTIVCLHCGLRIAPKIEYMQLKELNQLRLDNYLKKIPKNKRPKQNYDLL